MPTRDFHKYECQCSKQAHELVAEKTAGGAVVQEIESDKSEKNKSVTLTVVESEGSSNGTP